MKEEEEVEEEVAAEGPENGARAGTALEQAWAWGSSSSELGLKEQGCSFWLAMTNDSFSSHHLLIDDCVRVQAHTNNCCLNGWGMWRAGEKKKPSGNGVTSLFGISKYVSYLRYVC